MPFPGCLILVVGPSGAGKDSLMSGAQAQLPRNGRFRFVRRYITRPAEAGGEDHIPIAPDVFQKLVDERFFCLHWQAHDLLYGIPVTINDEILDGRTVIANVSRSVLDTARTNFPYVRIINVTAPPDILAARLHGRGRESLSDVTKRLGRSVQVAGNDVFEVVNDGSIEDGIRKFTTLINAFTEGGTPAAAQ